MFPKGRFLRAAAGSTAAVLTLVVGFALVFSEIPSWGAEPEEASRLLPGDELFPNPTLKWTNAVTIDAPPDQVWGWIAQLGDTRAGFYSYTFIENRLARLFPDYPVVYKNAAVLVNAWQHPAPGDQLIKDILAIRGLQEGQWILSESIEKDIFHWGWLWYLEPLNEGQQTRMLVRFLVKVTPELESPVYSFLMTTGGFVMQQRMMQGIRLRAEGGAEPSYYEGLEISIWLSVLVIGLAAAILTVFQERWLRPLLLGVISLAALIFITFYQPDVVLRLLILSLLLAMLLWARWGGMGMKAAPLVNGI